MMRDHEEAMLSCILWDASILFKTILTDSHFLETEPRRLYRAMHKCAEKGLKLDYLSLGDMDAELDRTYAPYISALMPSSANWRFYEGKIVEAFQRSRLRHIGQYLSALDDAESAADYIERAEKDLFDLSTNCKTGEIKKLADLVPAALKVIEERYKLRGKLPGLSVGISGLDTLIGGLQESRYIIVGARPSDGKSALAVNMLCHIGIHEGASVGLISAESSNNEIVSRVFASEGRINGMRLSTGMLSSTDFAQLLEVGQKIGNAPIYIYDAPNIKFGELKSVARQMVAAYKIKALFVDYVQIIQWEERSLPHHEQVANVSMGLKSLARELRIPIVGLSQLKRDSEGREPQMADLDYSKQIEQDADALVFIYHPQKDDSDTTPSKLLLKKNRDGAKGAVNVTFRREYVKFYQTEGER